MKTITAIILLLFCTGTRAQDGSHVFSGLFDVSATVEVVAMALSDSTGCATLFRGSFTDSYTIKLPAVPGIVVFFYAEGYRQKTLYLPDGGRTRHNLHQVNVRFKKATNYLIYKAANHKKGFETQVLE